MPEAGDAGISGREVAFAAAFRPYHEFDLVAGRIPKTNERLHLAQSTCGSVGLRVCSPVVSVIWASLNGGMRPATRILIGPPICRRPSISLRLRRTGLIRTIDLPSLRAN